jgi:hypothetical protein
MGQRAHQQLGAREFMPQRGFQFLQNGFQMRLDPILPCFHFRGISPENHLCGREGTKTAYSALPSSYRLPPLHDSIVIIE